MLVPDKAKLVRQKFREYFASERFDRDFHEMHPSRKLTIAAVLLTFAMWRPRLAWRALGGARRRGFASARLRRAYEELAEIGVPAVGYPAMENMHLRGGSLRHAPALLVLALSDRATEEETERCAAIVGSACLIAKSPEEKLARILKDENFRFRRREIPHEITKGREVYAFDALLAPHPLPKRYLNMPRVVCIVDPRRNGLIMPLPLDIAQVCGLAEPRGEAVRR